MTSRTHDLIAFSFLITVAAFYPPSSLNLTTLISCFVGNVTGSLLPDIDQASNRLWDMLPGGNFVGKILKNLFLQHRALSHSFLGMYLLYKGLEFVLPRIFNPLYVDTKLIYYSIMIGAISHLAADSLTERGLPLLFPLKFKFGFPPFKSWRIVTGGWFEKIVIFPVTIAYLFWFVFENKDRLIKILNLVKG